MGAVSIPQWCDCCSFALNRKLTGASVSIPQWCDCCFLPSTLCACASCVSIPQWCDCCASSRRPCRTRIWFQSHNGAIAARPSHKDSRSMASFNPTMVRLLHPAHPTRKDANLCFNPTMVRLLHPVNLTTIPVATSVSIPQWCDCCRHDFETRKRIHSCFNPTMVRLLPNF